MARARALTAAHNLTAAAFELDAIRSSTTDEVVRDVVRIMLVDIYLEQGDYARAQSLLEETYKARSAQNEGSTRSYFAVAGQTLNGVRAHLERYRTFGLNIADRDLPPEAINDLDRLRGLLERVAEQAREVGAGDDKNSDAFALLEDVANVRASLARDMEDRARWQGQIAEARQHLTTAAGTRLTTLSVASVSPSPALTAAQSITTPPPAATQPAASTASNAPAKSESAKAGANTAETAAATAAGQPLNLGALLEKATQKVSPSYPAFAKTAHVSGIVRVDMVIDEKGSVVSAQSSTGPAILRQAAIDAARRWKFRPTMSDGQPVRVVGFLNFNFTPQ